MTFTQIDFAAAAYVAIIIGGLITLFGGLIVYFNKGSKIRK